MRLLTAAGLLILWAGSGRAAYVVELDAGDRMTVDSYWEEGGRIHLMRGGVDLNVPRSRVKSLRAVSGDPESGVGRVPTETPAPRAAAGDGPKTRDDLELQQRRIDHHLLRVQRERFEARARGESGKKVDKLDREFKRTQQRRFESMKQLGDAPTS